MAAAVYTLHKEVVQNVLLETELFHLLNADS